MGSKTLQLQLPTNYSKDDLIEKIKQTIKIKNFTYQIENQGLDARKKSMIHWLTRVVVVSDEIQTQEPKESIEKISIPFLKTKKKVLVVGNGPAGFFASYALQKAGFQVKMIDRGASVETRSNEIQKFEKTGIFNSKGNYAYGEGGAGTFSDGKLTSRSKHISKEREFIVQCYLEAGAPSEIAYLAHPHLGSDNLRKIVANLRKMYQDIGGEIQYEKLFTDCKFEGRHLKEIWIDHQPYAYDYIIIAPGHSAYDTYRTLIKRGVPFRTKNFAIGCRAEHPQELINIAQWGKKTLPGVKAAEYRLTSEADGKHHVFSFCMCPGGNVVPAAAFPNSNIVNGMSNYQRDGKYANAACVAGIHPNQLFNRELSPLETLDEVEKLETYFYELTNSFSAPICSIQSFIKMKHIGEANYQTSYPLSVFKSDLWNQLPRNVVKSMQAGLIDFSRKLKGYETGNLIGLESKTSSPIQVLRTPNGLCESFDNLFVVGEGSGYSGGIVSSGADGLKAALNIIAMNS